MGPVNVLIAFTALGLTPMLVRRAAAATSRSARATAAVLAALTAAWGARAALAPGLASGRARARRVVAGIRAVLPWTTARVRRARRSPRPPCSASRCAAARATSSPSARRPGVVSVVGSVTVAVALGATWAVAAVLAARRRSSPLVVGWGQLALRASQRGDRTRADSEDPRHRATTDRRTHQRPDTGATGLIGYTAGVFDLLPRRPPQPAARRARAVRRTWSSASPPTSSRSSARAALPVVPLHRAHGDRAERPLRRPRAATGHAWTRSPCGRP